MTDDNDVPGEAVVSMNLVDHRVDEITCGILIGEQDPGRPTALGRHHSKRKCSGGSCNA